jgi:hypothetical protein
MKRQLELVNTYHNSKGTLDVGFTRPLAPTPHHLYQNITYPSTQRLYRCANTILDERDKTLWRIRLYSSGFTLHRVAPPPVTNALYACQQLVYWIDHLLSEKNGEEWWAKQAPALQEAYITAQIAVRQAQ